jgi:hypothetical protein
MCIPVKREDAEQLNMLRSHVLQKGSVYRRSRTQAVVPLLVAVRVCARCLVERSA